MCKVSDKIKFCSCAAEHPRTLNHYWVLHRYRKDKGKLVVGIVGLPPFINTEVNEANRELLQRRLNEDDAFDVELNAEENDRLQITFRCEGQYSPLHYGFCFKRGKWEEVPYSSLSWQWEHIEDQFGKITDALEKG